MLYGCETWSLTLSEEQKKNSILRRIFRPRWDENTELRSFYIEEIFTLYRSVYIVRVSKSKRLRRAGYIARIEVGMSVFFIILKGKSTRKKPLGRPSRRLEDNVRIDFK